MIFKYSEFETKDGKKVYRPTIDIVFKSDKRFINVVALIDSSADYSILPIEIAGELGLKLKASDKTIFYGAGDNPFPVYRSPFKIEHILREGGFRPINWRTFIYFAEAQPTILLGNNGFLNKFIVILNGIKKELEIKEK